LVREQQPLAQLGVRRFGYYRVVQPIPLPDALRVIVYASDLRNPSHGTSYPLSVWFLPDRSDAFQFVLRREKAMRETRGGGSVYKGAHVLGHGGDGMYWPGFKCLADFRRGLSPDSDAAKRGQEGSGGAGMGMGGRVGTRGRSASIAFLSGNTKSLLAQKPTSKVQRLILHGGQEAAVVMHAVRDTSASNISSFATSLSSSSSIGARKVSSAASSSAIIPDLVVGGGSAGGRKDSTTKSRGQGRRVRANGGVDHSMWRDERSMTWMGEPVNMQVKQKLGVNKV
jgi:hypothetical protein